MGLKRVTAPSKRPLIFSTISSPRFKSIQAFWDELWVLEWSQSVFPTIYDHIGTSSVRLHRINGELQHEDGLTEGDNTLWNSLLFSQLYPDQVSKRFRNFGKSYGFWNGASFVVLSKCTASQWNDRILHTSSQWLNYTKKTGLKSMTALCRFFVFSSISRPGFKAIRAFWCGLWRLEWSKIVISFHIRSQGMSSDFMHQNQGEITPRRRGYSWWQPHPNYFISSFSTIFRLSFKAIQTIWDKLWMLEWNKVVISYYIWS